MLLSTGMTDTGGCPTRCNVSLLQHQSVQTRQQEPHLLTALLGPSGPKQSLTSREDSNMFVTLMRGDKHMHSIQADRNSCSKIKSI